MMDSKKRIALKPHMKKIREWVDAGKTDEWIADALGTSASSVQSFRSRNDIYRRDRGRSEQMSVFEGVLDHGEQDGWGMWFDPSVADDPIWKEHWAGVDSVVVKLAEDSIVLEVAKGENRVASVESAGGIQEKQREREAFDSSEAITTALADTEFGDGNGSGSGSGGLPGESGRVKWFDSEKGYGFLIRPSGEDLFVHHSEIQGDPGNLQPGVGVEYEVGKNDRGPNARHVRLMD